MIDPEQRAREMHVRRYGDAPKVAVAPGRVNLIGEHTDYNDGFVLPMAIDRRTAAAFSARDDGAVRIYSCEFDDEVSFRLNDRPPSSAHEWTSYTRGMAFALRDRGYSLKGAEVTVASNVPIGAGLSSSASLEVAVGKALAANAGLQLDPRQLALIAQGCEHRFAGVLTGIMDQLTATSAKAGHALLIDCRTLNCEPVPVPDRWSVAICDSLVHHDLGASQYNERRRDCETARDVLASSYPNVRALRDADLEMLDSVKASMDERIYRRALHVIGENARTIEASQALRNADGARFGELMRRSHASLHELYEVTIPELDALAQTCAQVPGVYGARMTGGGFGGCVVAVMERGAEQRMIDCVTAAYYRPKQKDAAVWLVQPSAGASLYST